MKPAEEVSTTIGLLSPKPVSRMKEITEEATITIGFTFFRTREPAEEASITIGFSFSRITKPAE
jgi:hypothetical protein